MIWFAALVSSIQKRDESTFLHSPIQTTIIISNCSDDQMYTKLPLAAKALNSALARLWFAKSGSYLILRWDLSYSWLSASVLIFLLFRNIPLIYHSCFLTVFQAVLPVVRSVAFCCCPAAPAPRLLFSLAGPPPLSGSRQFSVAHY